MYICSYMHKLHKYRGEQCLVNSIPLKIAAIEAALDRAASGWKFTWLIANI